MPKIPALLSKMPAGIGALGASIGSHGANSPALVSQLLGGALQGYKHGGRVKHMREGGTTMDPYVLASAGEIGNDSSAAVSYGNGSGANQTSGSGTGASSNEVASSVNPATWTKSEIQGYVAKNGLNALLSLIPGIGLANGVSGLMGWGTAGTQLRNYLNDLQPSEYAHLFNDTSANDAMHYGGSSGLSSPDVAYHDALADQTASSTGTDAHGAYVTDPTGVRVYTDANGDQYIIGANGKPDYSSSQADISDGANPNLAGVTVSGSGVPTQSQQAGITPPGGVEGAVLAPVTVTGQRESVSPITPAPMPGIVLNDAPTMPAAPGPATAPSPAPAPTPSPAPTPVVAGGTPSPSPAPSGSPAPAPTASTDFQYPGLNLGTIGNHRMVAYDPAIMGGVDAARPAYQTQLQQSYLQGGVKPLGYRDTNTGLLTNAATAGTMVNGQMVPNNVKAADLSDPSHLDSVLADALNANPQLLHDPQAMNTLGQNIITQYKVDPMAYQRALGNYLAAHPLYQGMGGDGGSFGSVAGPGGPGSVTLPGGNPAPAPAPNQAGAPIPPPLVSHPATPAPAPAQGPLMPPAPAPAQSSYFPQTTTPGGYTLQASSSTNNSQQRIADLLKQDPTGRDPAIVQQLMTAGFTDFSHLPSPQDVLADQYRSGQVKLPPGWTLSQQNGQMMPTAPDGTMRWPEEMTPLPGSPYTQQQWDQISGAGSGLAPGTVVPQYGTTAPNALVTNIQHQLGNQTLTPDLVRQYSTMYGSTPQAIGAAFGFTPDQVNTFMMGNHTTGGGSGGGAGMKRGGEVMGALARGYK